LQPPGTRYWNSDNVSTGPANEGVGLVFSELGEEVLSWTAVDANGRVLSGVNFRTGKEIDPKSR